MVWFEDRIQQGRADHKQRKSSCGGEGRQHITEADLFMSIRATKFDGPREGKPSKWRKVSGGVMFPGQTNPVTPAAAGENPRTEGCSLIVVGNHWGTSRSLIGMSGPYQRNSIIGSAQEILSSWATRMRSSTPGAEMNNRALRWAGTVLRVRGKWCRFTAEEFETWELRTRQPQESPCRGFRRVYVLHRRRRWRPWDTTPGLWMGDAILCFPPSCYPTRCLTERWFRSSAVSPRCPPTSTATTPW